MINGKTVLALIPARGGSKGIPRKNIILLAGKPLIAWTIEEAIKSKYIDRIILSSEDETIMKIAKKWGCDVPFIRPVELSKDESSSIDVVVHAIDNINNTYDFICLLQPTSPLRTTDDIDKCIEKCINGRYNSCVSISEVKKSPYLMYKKITNDILVKMLDNNYSRRQEMPKFYIINGAIYIIKTDVLKKTKRFIFNDTIGYEMKSVNSIDIDDNDDLYFAEYIISKRR